MQQKVASIWQNDKKVELKRKLWVLFSKSPSVHEAQQFNNNLQQAAMATYFNNDLVANSTNNLVILWQDSLSHMETNFPHDYFGGCVLGSVPSLTIDL